MEHVLLTSSTSVLMAVEMCGERCDKARGRWPAQTLQLT